LWGTLFKRDFESTTGCIRHIFIVLDANVLCLGNDNGISDGRRELTMERKLASIQRIKDLSPIEGADRIEKATVLGWGLVVQKGEFKVGDLCVFCEVDSVLPERPEFEFLRDRKFRIKTIKLKGQVSQGICFPISILPEGYFDLSVEYEGVDVTELLGVKKYEPQIPAQLMGQAKGNFPGFLRKTDEMRIQSVPRVLERQRGKFFYVTEKLDGTSATYFSRDEDFGICSRNIWLKDNEANENNSYVKMAKMLDIQSRLKPYGNIAIQGEIVGPGIQKNKYGLSELDFFLFSIFFIDVYKYANFYGFLKFAELLNLKTVPILERKLELNHSVEELIEMSKGKSELAQIFREGIVIRTVGEEDIDEEIGRISFKVINPDFLLKYEV